MEDIVFSNFGFALSLLTLISYINYHLLMNDLLSPKAPSKIEKLLVSFTFFPLHFARTSAEMHATHNLRKEGVNGGNLAT